MSLLLSPEAIENYAIDFTVKVTNEAFEHKESLNGNDLVHLTPVKQVNIGILTALSQKWIKTAEAFHSPYFNFAHPDVKQALQHLLNTASRHIEVKKHDLSPLLKNAVIEALTLLVNPLTFFEQKVDSFLNTGFSSKEASQLIKQTQIHQGVARALSLRLEESPHSSASTVLAKQWLSELLEKDTLLDPVDNTIAQFSVVQPLQIAVKEVPAPAAFAAEEKSFFDSLFDGEVIEKPTAPPIQPRTPSPEPVQPQVVVEPQHVQTAQAPVIPPQTSKAATLEAETINSRYKVDMPEVSDAGKFGHVQVKVDSISKGLSIGQRFMFINQLFHGNSDEFEQAVNELDHAPGLKEATQLIHHTLAGRFGWDLKGEAETELLTIVKRRFN